ncbi:MAG TPA: LysR family transcriptional regulator [Burkholderiaceae bacterium]|jgi:DNA-binding transcriptional LysR family regulator|nr:LysR family transcriptional regulator [Burkholderiaceae bacterium]
MEMHQIRYFLAVCDKGSFSRAAEAMGVSQPALTTAIRKLEEETGYQLFHREGRQLVLSELGRMVQPHLQQVLDRSEAAKEVARNFRLLKQAPLRVGVLLTIGAQRLARFFAAFRAQNPGVELAVHATTAERLSDELKRGELDFGITSLVGDPPDELRGETLYDERYVVVFRSGHRLGRFDAIRLEDVSGEDYVDRLSCELREMVMAACADRRVELYAKFRSDREDWVQAMVAAGLGFAFMPEHSVTLPELLQRPLADPPVRRTITLVDVRGRARSPAAKMLARSITNHRWDG